jgi:hypothetical protein
MKRLALLLAVAGCASSPPVPSVRFENAPPVHAVNDRRDVPKTPDETMYERYLRNFDGSFHNLVTTELELKRHERARGINALDEVPNSTWFTNRIGVREVSVEEIKNLPGSVGTPEDHKPWTIVSSKVGGLSVGFIMKDARGEKFLLKFDPKGFPETETATQIVIGRILWALGYNVTDDYIVKLRKEDLVLDPEAKVKDPSGDSFPLDQKEFDARMAAVDVAKDGTMRALASRYLDGKPLGGHAAEGVRDDDPNDLIPHELRRDLRGTRAIFSWLDHSDLHLGNSLDMYVTDPDDPKRHYVKHYFIDFGIALGAGAAKNENPRYGYEYQVDWAAMAKTFFTFGLVQRPWEARKTKSQLRGVGTYDVANYKPGDWIALTPMYTPVRIADRIDGFWASKIMMKLERKHLEAAVEAAKLSDPRAAKWLVDALIARQRKTAEYYFSRTNPVDEFRATGNELCFKDLSIVYGFKPAQNTRYRVAFHDRNGKRFGRDTVAPGTAGSTCAPLKLSTAHDGYTIVQVHTTRPGFSGSTYVYVARDARTQMPHVIGIWRK